VKQGNTPSQDALAELLAQGLAMREYSERLGIARSAANAIMQRIRKGLGPQAV
jgi:DNA-binding CsgD family transcriptional regulator